MGLLSNPAMMEQMSSMMKNPEIQKMMNDPNILNNVANMMNNNTSSPKEENKSPLEPLKEENKYDVETTVTLINLKNDLYNNKNGIIESFNKETNRYNVLLDDPLNKVIAIKEENIKLLE